MEGLSHSAYSSSVFPAERGRFFGSFLRSNGANRRISPQQIAEERTASYRQRIHVGLTPRIGPRAIGRSQVYSPDPEPSKPPNRPQEDSNLSLGNFSIHIQKLSSVSQSPAKRFPEKKSIPSARPKTNYAISSFENLYAAHSDPDQHSKYLLIRQKQLQTQPKTKSEMQKNVTTLPMSPVVKRRNGDRPTWNPIKKGEKRKYQIPPEAQVKPRPVPPKKEEKVSVKDAMRDKEWMSKAREGMLQTVNSLIQRSFGTSVTPSSEGYRFFVGKGNNAQLVKSVFGVRWWWTRVEEEEKHTANLVWTQWKEKEWMLAMDSVEQTEKQTAAPGDVSTLSLARYNPSSSPFARPVPFGRVVDFSPLGFDLIFKSGSFATTEQTLSLSPNHCKTHNKLEGNHHLANKKALFINMKQYYECMDVDPFASVPLTFHIKDGESDPEFLRFLDYYTNIASDSEEDVSKRQRNIWILKPGENTNRGTGIRVCNHIDQIKEEMKTNTVCPTTGVKRTFILQKYLDKPFLVNRRKFDIRLYALVTCANGILQAYYYNEGYIRTSSKEFNINNVTNKLIHLTNDAVQKFSDDYGKFEMANKLSYSDFQRYLDTHYKERNVNFLQDVAPRMKALVKDTIQAVYLKIDQNHRAYSFEVRLTQVFGYDFMLDEDLKPWLIEVNTNPCLELSAPLLARIIPSMLENAFKLAVDPFFLEPSSRRVSAEVIAENRFELIFHELVDGPLLKSQLGAKFRDLEYEDPAIHDLPPDEDILSEDDSPEGG